ncbi:MAG: 50S ribosomal protein L9 [Gammaproteobacteria bacterium]|nr:50S ribosomal protein L9 [Gammaproteobacteria bacterium]
MELILLEKVENLGNIGDVVNVKSGFGRNFLMPKGKAQRATPENIKALEGRRAELEAAAAAELKVAQDRGEKITALGTITIKTKVGEEGKLFGSLGNIDIAEAVVAAGADLERSEVRLPEGPLRIAGEHDVDVHLHSDVNVVVKISVVDEGEDD